MFALTSVGSGRWKAERFRSGAYGGTKEVAERQSRLPTESGRICAVYQSGRAGAERSESSRSAVSAGRSRNGASVGPAGLPNPVGMLLFCEACSDGGNRRPPTVFHLEPTFCGFQLSSLWAALDGFQYAFRSCGSPPGSPLATFVSTKTAVPLRIKGRIDQREYVWNCSRIDSGDARRWWRFGWDVGDGSGAIPKEGGKGRRK